MPDVKPAKVLNVLLMWRDDPSSNKKGWTISEDVLQELLVDFIIRLFCPLIE